MAKGYETLKMAWIDQVRNGISGDLNIVQYTVSQLCEEKQKYSEANNANMDLAINRQIEFLLWISDQSGSMKFEGSFPTVYFHVE